MGSLGGSLSLQYSYCPSSSALPGENIEGPQLLLPLDSDSRISGSIVNLLYCLLTYFEDTHGHVDDRVPRVTK